MQISLRRLWAVSAAVAFAGLGVACDSDLDTNTDSAKSATTSARDEDTSSTTKPSDRADAASDDTSSDDTTDTTALDEADNSSESATDDDSASGFREFPTPSIDLIDAGTDPEVRTFTFRVGDTVTQIENSEVHMEQSGGGGSVTIDYTATGRTKNTVVAVDGDVATIRQVFESMNFTLDNSVPAQVSASMESVGDAMNGLEVDIEVDSRGNILSATPDPSTLPDSDEMTTQVLTTVMNSLGSGSQPWPKEPVGVGARWTQRTESIASGVETAMTSDVKLVSIESGVARIESTNTIEQSAAPGSTMDVDGTGSGSLTRSVTLGTYLGQTLQTEAATDANMTTAMGDQRLVMEILTSLKPEG